MFRPLISGIIGTLTAFAIVGSAAAIPGGDNSETFVLTCDNGEAYTVVVNGGGFSVGHIVPGNRKFIPVSIAVEGTYTPPGGGDPEEFSDLLEKGNAPRNKTLLTCTFGDSFSDPETGESFEFSGTVVGYLNR